VILSRGYTLFNNFCLYSWCIANPPTAYTNYSVGVTKAEGFLPRLSLYLFSYFIMISKLVEDRYVDYEKYIRKIDAEIPRAFIKNIIQDIVVADGRVQSITFRNGMIHAFTYKQ